MFQRSSLAFPQDKNGNLYPATQTYLFLWFNMKLNLIQIHHYFYQVFLKSDRVSRMVQSGGCSSNDSREVFKKHIEKRVRSLPEIDGLSKETVLSSWIAKFDTIYRGEEDPRKHQQRITASAASELILSKDQLYEMFQQILGIKKFEHQLLYNACQVRQTGAALCSPWLYSCSLKKCNVNLKISIQWWIKQIKTS